LGRAEQRPFTFTEERPDYAQTAEYRSTGEEGGPEAEKNPVAPRIIESEGNANNNQGRDDLM
jgi:hypothetical protein